ncbi:hypothetical protein F1654_02690 [Alkalicaulis satelles]|uniref:Uncharacterized protein n=1 Tax=Alkalicaulis satelles TaxID=2609175 RepID=A0A5M6ZJE0_9PROT|nr:hypothetical protein [Alkalicaulis satelles]KAA5804923.1 hypothetical protein F1654_02690 [Alkalicaulis satelles]
MVWRILIPAVLSAITGALLIAGAVWLPHAWDEFGLRFVMGFAGVWLFGLALVTRGLMRRPPQAWRSRFEQSRARARRSRRQRRPS